LKDDPSPQPSPLKEKEKIINEEIKDIDVSDIKSVKFKFKN